MSKKPTGGSGSRRRRGRNADDETSPKTSKGAQSPDSSEPGESEKATPDAEREQAEAKPSPQLPAFGFADEVLARRPSEESSTAPETELDAAALAAAAVPKADDPERVYAFADSVTNIHQSTETVAPKLITTWVTFDLAQELFAIPVDEVHEVLRVSTITRVPHAPHPIRGVTNLRGRVIPVIDLRVRIELPAKEIDRASRILVVHPRGRVLGLLVDGVRQVVHLDLNAVQAPPDDVMTVQSDYLTGVYQLEDELLLLLDVDRALVIKESGAA